jgi:hypothetical protein
MNNLLNKIKRINFEAWIWITGLAILAIINPGSQAHFTICPFKNLGFKYCPGCGLGHSISYLFHGNIKASLQTHILGIPAIIILSARTVSIIKKSISNLPLKINQNERKNNGKHFTNNALP